MSSPWRPRRCRPSAAERPTPDRRQTFARRGERLAAWYLRLKGYRIEARNWRCPQGEMDIIAWDGDTLVFVEVKARASGLAGTPEEAVDARKQQRLIRIATVFLAGRSGPEPPCRFDVIAIRRNGMRLTIRHLRSAFRADS